MTTQYRVLGLLQVDANGPVSLGPKVGRLLATLLAARGEAVPPYEPSSLTALGVAPA